MAPGERGARVGISIGVAVGLAVWIAVPVVALLSIRNRVDQHTPIATKQQWALVQASNRAAERSVSLRLEREPPSAVFAPSMSGAIEAIRFGVNDVIRSGDRILVVGGVERIAFASGVPFDRPLRLGDRGRDVSALNALLASLALPNGASDRFTGATRAGVVQLRSAIGAPAQAADVVFDPGWIVFLPAPALTVASSTLLVGQPAPPAGTQIIEARPRLERVTISDSAPRTPAVAGDDQGASRGPPPGAAAPGGTGGGPAPAASPLERGERLIFAGTELPLTGSRDHVADPGFEVLDRLVEPGATAVDALAVRDPVARESVVPTSAIFTARQQACVIRRRDGARTPVEVAVRSVDFGIATVAADLRVGDRVAVAVPASQRRC